MEVNRGYDIGNVVRSQVVGSKIKIPEIKIPEREIPIHPVGITKIEKGPEFVKDIIGSRDMGVGYDNKEWQTNLPQKGSTIDIYV